MTTKSKPPSGSWIDKVFRFIDDQAWPAWLIYLALYLAFVVLFQVVTWVDGVDPWGLFSAKSFFNALWIPVGFASLHYLNARARQAMQEFRPAINCSNEVYFKLEDQMTTLPNRVVAVVNTLVAIALIWIGFGSPESLSPELTAQSVGLWFAVPYMTIGFSLVFLLVYQTIRRLLLMIDVYALVERINLFNLQSLYALSGLNVRTGFVLIVYLNLNLVARLVLETGPQSTVFAITLVEVILIVLVFILPVLGIHQRIQTKKEELLNENGSKLELVNHDLNVLLEGKNLPEIGNYERGISVLLTMRKEIKAISTWPWNPATFRGFLSAVFLPILLFAMQQVLLRFF